MEFAAEKQQGATVLIAFSSPESIQLIDRTQPWDGDFGQQVRKIVLPVVGLVERVIQVRQET